MSSTVGIVDYGMGNLDSVARAVEECGATPVVAAHPDALRRASAFILPGVGAFGDGMKELRARGFIGPLRHEVLENAIPLLGICLGMQLLAGTGFEGGEAEGLGFINGTVRRLVLDSSTTRIPHVGWNEVHVEHACPLFDDIPNGKDFYFVHSYHFVCDDAQNIVARTPYCGGFVSCVNRANVYGVQFHPEKSQRPGLHLLRNFLAITG